MGSPIFEDIENRFGVCKGHGDWCSSLANLGYLAPLILYFFSVDAKLLIVVWVYGRSGLCGCCPGVLGIYGGGCGRIYGGESQGNCSFDGLGKAVMSLSILLVFRVSVSSSSLSATLFFDLRIAIGLVFCRSY